MFCFLKSVWGGEGGGGAENGGDAKVEVGKKKGKQGRNQQIIFDLINFFPSFFFLHIVSGSSLRCIAKNASSSPSSNAA